MVLATFRSIRLAERRARKVESWLRYLSGKQQLLNRNVFKELQPFLSEYPHSIPGLVYPTEPNVSFNLQMECVERWLWALLDHYDERVSGTHVHPDAYDAVFAIFDRHISKHKQLARAAKQMAELDEELRWLAS